MKKVYLIHGWEGEPGQHFSPWLSLKLKENNFEVVEPQMPNTETPKIEEWVPKLEEIVGMLNEETFFVGHSIGCQAIMRFIESLQESTKIGGVVFVAGWFNLENLENDEARAIAKPWIETPVNFEKVKKICPKISVLLSSNETFGAVEENKKIFEEKLNAKVVILENKGHFTEGDGVIELPEALEEILKMAKEN